MSPNVVANHLETSGLAKLLLVPTGATQELSLTEEIDSSETEGGIVGRSPALRRVLQLVDMVAESDATVLILGEDWHGQRARRPGNTRAQPTTARRFCDTELCRDSKYSV